MDDFSTFERQGIFQFMALPPELRINIYRFAAVEPHPLTLYAHYDHRSDCLKGYAVEKDLGMLETCKKIRKEMGEVLYSENTFYLSIGLSTDCKKGPKTSQINIRRIQKCYIYVHMVTDLVMELDNNCEEDSDNDRESMFEIQWFINFVATLVFKGHQMKYLLVECNDLYNNDPLAKSLSPLSMLRDIGLVHFRSVNDEMFPFFRCLEGLMMGERPQIYVNMYQFWRKSTNFDYDLLKNPEACWFVEGLDVKTSAEVQSKEQRGATAQELYSILGMKGGCQPQSYLRQSCSLW